MREKGEVEIALLAKCFLHNNENFSLAPSTGRSGIHLEVNGFLELTDQHDLATSESFRPAGDAVSVKTRGIPSEE